MATKKTGISRDLIIHPGETIADILEERGITRADLAKRAGVSPAYVTNVINGKKGISARFAMGLEYVLDVPKSFWLNLQANYEAELLECNEEDSITETEYEALNALKDVIKYLRQSRRIPLKESKEQTILSLRKALRISNLSSLKDVPADGAFRVAAENSVDPFVFGAWLRLCQITGETKTLDTKFQTSRINELTDELKLVMTDNVNNLQETLSEIMARYGICFSIIRNFRGAPVHGYISQNKCGGYQMTLTLRGAYADIFWFSLFHELGHIINGDISKTVKYVDTAEGRGSELEEAADAFARNALLDPSAYASFIKKNDYSITAVEQFAGSQSVPAYIVIGRLQKDRYIPYNRYNQYRIRYQWA